MQEKQKVKNEFDTKLEKIKGELETFREDFHKEVDEICDNAIK